MGGYVTSTKRDISRFEGAPPEIVAKANELMRLRRRLENPSDLVDCGNEANEAFRLSCSVALKALSRCVSLALASFCRHTNLGLAYRNRSRVEVAGDPLRARRRYADFHRPAGQNRRL
jgi:hypothetical protein